MSPTKTTQSASRPATGSKGGGTGGQGSEVNDGVSGVPDFSTVIAKQLQNLLPTIVAQVGDQGRGQENGRNQNDDAINDNIRGDVVDPTSMDRNHEPSLSSSPALSELPSTNSVLKSTNVFTLLKALLNIF
nr:hypothetical protein [Tanacetum cinerariifolium]